MARKGITDIIAVVLLLMITISMVGFAWLWFSRMTQNTQGQIDTQLNKNINNTAQTIMIENLDKTNNDLSIRNTGTQTINTTYLSIFVNNQLATCTAWTSLTIAPGGVSTCTAGLTLTGCSQVSVSAPGNKDQLTC